MSFKADKANPYLWSKDEIEEIITREPDRVHFESNSGKRSYFRKIFIDNISTNYVQCSRCEGFIFKYFNGFGSGQLLRHEEGKRHREGPGGDEFSPLVEEGPATVERGRRGRKEERRSFLVWDHCVDTGKKTSSGLEIRACAYCNKEIGASAAWATTHMKSECELVPEDVKKAFLLPRKRKIDDSSDDDDDDGQQDKVIKILTGLLSKQESKKPLKNYTDRDFDRD